MSSLAVISNRLYAAGEFQFDESGLRDNFGETDLLQWDGTNWSLVGDAPILDASKLVVADGSLFVSGRFQRGFYEEEGLAHLDGEKWALLNAAFSPNFAIGAANIYLPTFYCDATDTEATPAVWDGLEWSGFGSGIDGSVSAIAFHEAQLFIGGFFFNAGGKPSSGFGIWHEPPPEPRLRVRPFHEMVQVSWPATFADLAIETTTDLETQNWRPMVTAPVVTGSRRVVTNSLPSGRGFFRLRRP